MRIGIVGGLTRNETQYRRVAAQAGHELEFHAGVMAGGGAASLYALVRRCDLLLVATDVNSHGAVRATREVARTVDRPVLLHRRMGIGRFAELLRDLTPATARAS